MINITELESEARELYKYHPYLRYGQCLMNTLFSHSPAYYTLVTGTMYDPFYTDDNVAAFLNYLETLNQQGV
jgi:hypothetical protein